MAKHKDRIPGTVRWFDGEEGWGIIDSHEVPGGCFVHLSNIVGVGHRNLDKLDRTTNREDVPGEIKKVRFSAPGRGRRRAVTKQIYLLLGYAAKNPSDGCLSQEADHLYKRQTGAG